MTSNITTVAADYEGVQMFVYIIKLIIVHAK